MADNLHTFIYEVKGNVNWHSSARIATQAHRSKPGALRLTRMVDYFYLHCVFDEEKTKNNKKHKIDVNSIIGTKLMARDGSLSVLIPISEGSIRFTLQKGDISEIEKFICRLNDIKVTVMERAVLHNARYAEYVGPIQRVQTLFASKVEAKVPTLVLREPGLQRAAYKIPHKTNDTYKEPRSQGPNKAVKLDAQQENRQRTPNRTTQENKNVRLTVQEGNRQYTPNRTTQENKNAKLTIQQGNREHTPNKTAQENKNVKLAAQPGNRQHLSNVTLLKNLTASEASSFMRAKSYGENPQQNKTPASVPKIMSHPNNLKQKSRPASERMDNQRGDDLEKENICSPEKKRSPEKHSELWSTFGTPRKRTPLKENETSPQFSRPSSNTTQFYGRNGSSIRLKRNVRRPARRSVFEVPSSSSPSQTPRLSPSATTPTAARDSRTLRQSTLLSSYLNDGSSEVTSQGFTNLGNTCYMNAILQSILGLVPFVEELENTDILNAVRRSSLYSCMYNLFRCKNEDGSSVAKKNALRRLKSSLNSNEMTKRFSGHQQNDAHEFMNICLDQMKEEVQNVVSEDSDGVASKFCPVVRNFEGSLRKYIRCTGCKDLVTKDELFNHLSLNIPHSRSSVELSLTRLLGRFFQAEELERSCEKCKGAIAVQYLRIRTLPRVIILHLLRSEFDQHSGAQEKNSNRIHVDRYLEIGSFCSSDNSGPPPFVPRKTSPTKSLIIVDNETPFSDDDFVGTKPRRRLDMSATQDTSSDKDNKATAENLKKYPSWVYEQSKRLSLTEYIDSSDDDDNVKKAKLASLREIQLNVDEDEQIRRAKFASLQETQPHTSLREEVEAKPSEEQRGKIEETVNHLQENGRHSSGGQVPSKNDKETCSQIEPTHKTTTVTNRQEMQRHEEQVEFVNVDSLGEKREGLGEEEIRNYRTTSLQKKQTVSRSEEATRIPGSEEEQLRQALLVSQLITHEGDLDANGRSCGDVSDAELMEFADSLDEEMYIGSDSADMNDNKNSASNEQPANHGNSENVDNDKNCPNDNSNSSRKRPSLDSNIAEVPVAQEDTNGNITLNGGARNSVGTPSKRRKIDQPETDVVSSDADEDLQLKQVLEMSKKEQCEQEALEQSQMEQAIRLSLEGVNTTSENMVIEEPEKEIPSEMKSNGEEQVLSDDFSYGLVSVVSHVGSSTSVGHYISDVYDVKTNQWTRYDDITAKKIKEYFVRYDKLSDGYIYFYMHKKCMNLLKQSSSES